MKNDWAAAPHHDPAALRADRGPGPGLRSRGEDHRGDGHHDAHLRGRDDPPCRLGHPRQGYAVFVVKPGPGVLDYQARLLSAVTPFAESGGTAAAFVTDADGINDTTLKWVEQFVPGQIGARYLPHLSLGFATLDDLEVIEAEAFETFPIHPARIAVYHLGNNGNARAELKSSNV